MGRIYTVSYSGTITNAGGDTDLLEIVPADDKPIRLRGFRLGQTSEVGDAAEENLRVTVRRVTASFASGSGGSSVTPVRTDTADAAAGFTAECNNTTVATGTTEVFEECPWNERNTPSDFWYPDERFAPKAKGAEALLVRLEAAPADDLTGCFTFWVEEE